MARLKLSSLLYTAIMLVANTIVYAQPAEIKRTTVGKNPPKTILTFNLQKMPGVGPSGNQSYGIGSFDPDDKSEAIKGYPKPKNKPNGLTGEVQYYYVLNNFQFHYQNYCAGIYSKAYFLDKVRASKWNLSDTLALSKIPIICGFSVLAGYNKANEAVYIIDGNGNNDFGDDVLRPLINREFRNSADGAVPILTQYLSGKEIKQEKILALPINDNNFNKENTKIELIFTFPEFRYSKFKYQGEPYLICTDGVSMSGTFIYVLPDVPVFDRAAPEKKIGLNQFVHIGDKDFIFTGYEENGSKISIAVEHPQDFSLTETGTTKKTNSITTYRNNNIFSDQAGFSAPIIKGYNINPVTKDMPFVSTAELKGKYIFVDFWSTSCGPCIAEFPYLKEVYLKYDRKKLEIIGVLDERDSSVTARLLKDGNLIWPNIIADSKSTDISGYKINGYPTTYLINPEGVIIAVNLRGEELANKLKTLIK